MDRDTKKTISHTGIYAVGSILRNMVSFIMLPIYTRFLTPADYGTIELLNMILDFVGIIVGLRVGEAVFRFYTGYENGKDKKEVISSALILVMALNALGVLLIITTSGQLSLLVFGSNDFRRFIALFAFTLLFQSAIEVSLVYIRVQQRPVLFITFSILKLFVQLSLNIYFVVIRCMHVEGVIYSALLSGGFMSLLLLSYTFFHAGFHFSKDKSLRIIKFSLPLMVATLLSFYLTFGDRYFLQKFATLTDVGIYSLGYKFGFLLIYLTYQPFANIWDSQQYKTYSKPEAKQIFQKTFLVISLIMIYFAFGVSVFIRDILRIMSDKSFLPACRVVPVILIAYLIQGWTSFCSFGIYLKGQTIEVTYATVISVTVVTIAYIVLIPSFGAPGAAWATLAGMLSRHLWVYYKSKKYYNMDLPWRKVMAVSLIALGLFMASFATPENLLASIAAHALLLIVFTAMLLILPIFDIDDRQRVFNLIKNPSLVRALIFKA